jgi:hypothetical protein
MLNLLRYANRRTRDVPAIRRPAIAGYAALTSLVRFLPPPRVLLNGPGKAGTHLLSDCLALLPRMSFSGRHFVLDDFIDGEGVPYFPPVDPRSVALDDAGLRRYLRRCPDGMFATSHAPWHPSLRSALADLGFRQVLLLRDPRDQVVSYVFYVVASRFHHHHRLLANECRTMEERLVRVIRGIEPERWPLPDIAGYYDGFLAWDGDDAVPTLVTRYETLIGSRGGGDGTAQVAEVRRIAAFLDRPLGEERAGVVAARMVSSASPTFRQGRSNEWREHFTPAVAAAFDEVAGDLLERLGYDRDGER